VPRNVVTLAPRLLALPTRRNREAREAILRYLTDRYRARVFDNPARVEMDFPQDTEGRIAKDGVAAALDEMEPSHDA
jgi:hypothetical protein